MFCKVVFGRVKGGSKMKEKKFYLAFFLVMFVSGLSVNFYCQNLYSPLPPPPDVKWQTVGYNFLQKIDQDYITAVILDDLINRELAKDSLCEEKRNLLKTALEKSKITISMFRLIYEDALKVYNAKSDKEGGFYLTQLTNDWLKLSIYLNEVFAYYRSAMLVDCK